MACIDHRWISLEILSPPASVVAISSAWPGAGREPTGWNPQNGSFEARGIMKKPCRGETCKKKTAKHGKSCHQSKLSVLISVEISCAVRLKFSTILFGHAVRVTCIEGVGGGATFTCKIG